MPASLNTPAGEASELSPQDREYLAKTFRYHPLQGDQEECYTAIRAQFRALAETILRTVPPGRDRAVALTNLETAMFWANAGIARS